MRLERGAAWTSKITRRSRVPCRGAGLPGRERRAQERGTARAPPARHRRGGNKAREGLAGKKSGGRVCRANVAEALGRARGVADLAGDLQPGGRGITPCPAACSKSGLGMCIPTMMAYAKPEQLQRYVRPALRGEEIWCQLFSEPAGGSDVAGLRTRAVSDGDEWVINGQKVWTSGAHYSDFGMLVTRSDPNVPKHAGLTASLSTCTCPAWRCGRSTRCPGRRTSTRFSSPICACRMRNGWACRARAGRWRSPR